jgi:hypothetical protein
VTLARAESAKGWTYASDRAVYAALEPQPTARKPRPTERALARSPEQEIPKPIAELTEVLAGEASETVAEDGSHLEQLLPTVADPIA